MVFVSSFLLLLVWFNQKTPNITVELERVWSFLGRTSHKGNQAWWLERHLGNKHDFFTLKISVGEKLGTFTGDSILNFKVLSISVWSAEVVMTQLLSNLISLPSAKTKTMYSWIWASTIHTHLCPKIHCFFSLALQQLKKFCFVERVNTHSFSR